MKIAITWDNGVEEEVEGDRYVTFYSNGEAAICALDDTVLQVVRPYEWKKMVIINE